MLILPFFHKFSLKNVQCFSNFPLSQPFLIMHELKSQFKEI